MTEAQLAGAKVECAKLSGYRLTHVRKPRFSEVWKHILTDAGPALY